MVACTDIEVRFVRWFNPSGEPIYSSTHTVFSSEETSRASICR